MTTHYADHDADTGLTLTVELFALGSDTVVYTAGATAAQTNRIGTYRSTFTDVAAGTYELRSRVSSTIKGTWYVRFAGTDAEVVTGTTNDIPTVADIASAVWNAGTRTLTSFGTLVADVATAVWSAGTRTITGLTQAALALFATQDTGQTSAAAGSVAKLAQGGGSGSGAYTLTITVNDGTDELENATVRLTEGVNSYTATTDADGEAVFALDAATYSVAITKTGYEFTPTTKVVSATGTQAYSMTAMSVTPSDPPQTTAYVTIYTAGHTAVAGAVVEIQILKLANGTTGSGIDDPLISGTTDANGYVQFTGLPRGATYQVRVDGGPWSRGVTASASTTALAGVLGLAE